jgi:hypothetical protein
MKDELKNKVLKLVDQVSTGDFNSSTVSQLMTYLRSEFNTTPKLLDIANFVTHAEGRDKGQSFQYTKKFVNTVIDTFEKGGSFTIPKPLFERNDIFQAITEQLKKLEVLKSESDFNLYKEKFIECLMDLIMDTEIILGQENVRKCIVKKEDNKIFVCFNVQSSHPIFGGQHQIRLFD